MKAKRNYLLKVYFNKSVDRYETRSKRRFLNKTRTIKWQNSMFKVYLRVSYGDGIFNAGSYLEKKEFSKALKAFLE